MTLIRTFHPIGQGAFYTERHNFNGTDFTIVYDCGSTTIKREKLERKIKSTFPKGHSIDILFISHFHADHINGIEVLANHCNIKKVVLPLIDDMSKILLKVANLIEVNFSDTSLIDNPEDFFGGNTSIIRIAPTEINLNTDGIGINDPRDISRIEENGTYSSGTVFTPLVDIDWFFIPFNYEHDKRKIQFENALRTYGLTLADIDTINKINKNKRNIIKAYNDIDGDLNENSMVLFSGKKSKDDIQYLKGSHLYFHHSYYADLQSGCLYLGDIDLNELNIVADINVKLKQFLPFIGTLQIPHHGSIHNFANSILQLQPYCAIFSYGTNNPYSHPSDMVIGDVILKNIYPFHVTEVSTSMVIQCK